MTYFRAEVQKNRQGYLNCYVLSMKVVSRILFAARVLALGTTAFAANSSASSLSPPITGSIPFGGFTVTQDGANLGSSTLISVGSYATTGPGTGYFSEFGMPVFTGYGSATLDLAHLSAFSLSNATFGTFTASSGVIVQRTASFLDVFISGLYQPTPDTGLHPNSASLRVSLNQSGSSLSEVITLNAPALTAPALTDAPEPASVFLLASAFVCLASVSRRRFAR